MTVSDVNIRQGQVEITYVVPKSINKGISEGRKAGGERIRTNTNNCAIFRLVVFIGGYVDGEESEEGEEGEKERVERRGS